MSSVKTAVLLFVLAVPSIAAAQNLNCTSIQTGITVETTCTGAPSVQVVTPALMPLPALSVHPQQFQDPITTQGRLQQLEIQRLQIQALQAQRNLSNEKYYYPCGPSNTCWASSEKEMHKLERQYKKEAKKAGR